MSQPTPIIAAPIVRYTAPCPMCGQPSPWRTILTQHVGIGQPTQVCQAVNDCTCHHDSNIRGELLTIEEAAQLIDRSVRTLRRWIAAGILEPFTTDRHPLLYLDSAVYEAERKRRTGPFVPTVAQPQFTG